MATGKHLARMGYAAFLLLLSPAFLLAASFHWVDSEGFHGVDQIKKVPLEHRKDLPMVKNRTAFPFTGEENRDGAMYAWFIFSQLGVDLPRLKAEDFPKSPVFTRVDKPQAGDVAWWQGFVAVVGEEKGKLLSARGEQSLKSLEQKRGKVTWYRYSGPLPRKKLPPAKGAPQKAVREADEALARLDRAATFPPQIRDDAERQQIRKELARTAAGLEALRKRYPDDPQVLRRLGVCYRRGYNIGMPGAWERAEAYLLRAQVLAPAEPEAYISLGILYNDTLPDYGKLAEMQFRQALTLARKEQLPQVWWGLAVALYYQGKVQEAVAEIDRVIALHPDNAAAKQLRETILNEGTTK